MEPSSCDVCQGSNFDEVDGFYFCQTCGTQSQIHRVFEVEEFDDVLTANVATQIKKTGKKDGESKKKKKSREYTKAEYLQQRALSGIEFPKYLEHCGYRIGTFAKVLYHYGDILIRDFDLDDDVMLRIRYILQEYLRSVGIAFTDSEIAASDEDKFSILAKKTRKEINAEQAAEKRRLKKMRKDRNNKSKKKKTVSAAAALSQFFDADDTMLNEEEERIEEERIEEEIPVEIQAVRAISTNISRRAVIASGNVFLDTDLLLVLLYIACITSGATWIMLSDITRWYREGRFPINKSHLVALNFAVGMEGISGSSTSDGPKNRTWRTNYAAQPISESYRVLHAMIQMIHLPKEIVVKPSFTQILLRFVYNLNLPYSFMDRLRALEKLLPVDCQYSFARSRSEFYFDSHKMADFIQKPIASNYGSVSFFRKDENYNVGQEVSKRSLRAQGDFSVVLSNEAKAAALILLALKLMFGLDDVREYSLKPKIQDEAMDAEVFDFSRYLLQLRLRMDCWKGAAISKVLSKKYTAHIQKKSVFSSPSYVGDCRYRRNNGIYSRESRFSGCVPSFNMFLAKHKLFFNNFEDDFVDTVSKDFIGKEAMYAPLRHAATKNQAQLNEISRNSEDLLDQDNVEIFFKSNSDSLMDYYESTEESPAPYKERLKNDSQTEGSAARGSKWRSLFPSSSGYQVYPRTKNIRMLLRSNHEFDEADFIPQITYDSSEMVMETAKPCFSRTFAFLLEQLSTMIGESDHTVYFTLAMLEMMLFEKTRVQNLEQSLLSGEALQIEWFSNSWDVYLVDGCDVPRSLRRYAAHNRDVERGRGITSDSVVPVSVEAGLPILFWKSW